MIHFQRTTLVSYQFAYTCWISAEVSSSPLKTLEGHKKVSSHQNSRLYFSIASEITFIASK